MADKHQIVMPDRKSLTTLLETWGEGNAHYNEQLFPQICDFLAGREVTAPKIVQSVTLAGGMYVAGLPASQEDALIEQIKELITAITPEGAFRTAAIERWNEVRAKMNR